MRNVESNQEDQNTTGGRHVDEEVHRRGSSAPSPRRYRSAPPLTDEEPPRSRRRQGRGQGSDGNRNNPAKRNGGRSRCN
jgi:hypothetical protein